MRTELLKLLKKATGVTTEEIIANGNIGAKLLNEIEYKVEERESIGVASSNRYIEEIARVLLKKQNNAKTGDATDDGKPDTDAGPGTDAGPDADEKPNANSGP